MEQSLFVKLVQRYFKGLTVRVVETMNDSKRELPYLHKSMLKKDFSVTGMWETLSASYTRVMADIVSMDSSLPLKMRDSQGRASGEIPKMGLEMYLTETQLTALNTLIATKAPDSQIIAKLFNDLPKVIEGIYERLEFMFLEGLSTGVTSVTDEKNVGVAIRLDYKYPAANRFGVAVLWGSSPTTATPDKDIKRLLDSAKASGNVIKKVMLDSYALDNLAATTQMKELYAFKAGFVGGSVPVPDIQQINALTSSRYGFTFELVDRSMKVEKNGVRTTVKPWAEGQMVFLTGNQVGSLVWAKLAEMDNQAKQVDYSIVEDYILVSKYKKIKPLQEFTSGEARVAPVISNVDEIYVLDTKTVQG